MIAYTIAFAMRFNRHCMQSQMLEGTQEELHLISERFSEEVLFSKATHSCRYEAFMAKTSEN